MNVLLRAGMILSCGHEDPTMSSKYMRCWESKDVREVNIRESREREDRTRVVVRLVQLPCYVFIFS